MKKIIIINKEAKMKNYLWLLLIISLSIFLGTCDNTINSNTENKVIAIINFVSKDENLIINNRLNQASAFNLSVRHDGNEIFNKQYSSALLNAEVELEKGNYIFLLEAVKNDEFLAQAIRSVDLKNQNNEFNMIQIKQENSDIGDFIDFNTGRFIYVDEILDWNEDWRTYGYFFDSSIISNKQDYIKFDINFMTLPDFVYDIDKLYSDYDYSFFQGFSPFGLSLLSGGLPTGLPRNLGTFEFLEETNIIFNGKNAKNISIKRQENYDEEIYCQKGNIIFGIDELTGYYYPSHFEVETIDNYENVISTQIITFGDPVYIGNTAFCPVIKNGSENFYFFEEYTIIKENDFTYKLTIDNFNYNNGHKQKLGSTIGTYKWILYDQYR